MEKIYTIKNIKFQDNTEISTDDWIEIKEDCLLIPLMIDKYFTHTKLQITKDKVKEIVKWALNEEDTCVEK